jgi:hypothetical protein
LASPTVRHCTRKFWQVAAETRAAPAVDNLTLRPTTTAAIDARPRRNEHMLPLKLIRLPPFYRALYPVKTDRCKRQKTGVRSDRPAMASMVRSPLRPAETPWKPQHALELLQLSCEDLNLRQKSRSVDQALGRARSR